MAQEQAVNAKAGGNDLWVAAGVVICLGIGAGMTYWLTSESPAPQTSSLPVAVLKGDRMDAKTAAPVKPADAAAASSAATAPAETSKGDSDYASVGFDMLSGYFYNIPDLDAPKVDEKLKNQIPQTVKDLDGKKVAIRGFMYAMTQERGAVKTFLLLRDQTMCCFGRTPRMNEWVSVKMKDDKATREIRDTTVTIFGTLHVGELVEKGVVLSVYRLDADEVAGPLDL